MPNRYTKHTTMGVLWANPIAKNVVEAHGLFPSDPRDNRKTLEWFCSSSGVDVEDILAEFDMWFDDPTSEDAPATAGLESRLLVVLDEDWPAAVERTLAVRTEHIRALLASDEFDELVVQGRAYPSDFGILYRLNGLPPGQGEEEMMPIGRVEVRKAEGDTCFVPPPVPWVLPDEAIEALYDASEHLRIPVDDRFVGQAAEWLARAAVAVAEPRPGWRREAILAKSPERLLELVEEAFAAVAATRGAPHSGDARATGTGRSDDAQATGEDRTRWTRLRNQLAGLVFSPADRQRLWRRAHRGSGEAVRPLEAIGQPTGGERARLEQLIRELQSGR